MVEERSRNSSGLEEHLKIILCYADLFFQSLIKNAHSLL